MNQSKITLIGILMLSSLLLIAQTNNKTSLQKTTIPLGGNVYQINGKNLEEIDNDGISSWHDASSEFGIYFSSTQEKNVNLSLNIQKQQGNGEILVMLGNKSNKIKIKDGLSGNIYLGKISLLKGYNSIQFRAVSKNGEDYCKISDIFLEYEGASNFNYVKENSNGRYYFGRRGPSVHVSYKLPDNKNIKWFYNEVTVPVGEDIIGSYFMANGFGEGYFGIQVNSETERRILFSVWSPFVTDNPKNIPESEKIKLAKKGETVLTGEFGNEGSGGQSFMRYNWKAGDTYKFLNSVMPDGKGNSLYTAYFFDNLTNKWMLIAQFIRPKTTTWYTSPYSFLENFNPSMGYMTRKVKFGNQWACDENGVWFELNSARFTGDDIAGIGYRLDREGGVENNAFYLKNCGFFNTDVQLNTLFKRTLNNVAPVIDFEKLP